MDNRNQTDTSPSEFSSQLNPQQTTNYEVELFDLELNDEDIVKVANKQLDSDISHWEQAPWLLSQTDRENIAYLFGDQQGLKVVNPNTQTPYVDNRLFASVRAILAYATGQPAKPELLPSKAGEQPRQVAKQLGMGLYQHVLDHEVNQQFRLALKNLITRKRGYIKLRYDEDYGAFGDICTENVDPADIVIGRDSRYGKNPSRIYHKQKDTIQELCERFPDKKDQIYEHFGFKRGVYTQVSRVVTYWECWFSYHDKDFKDGEGVCWFLPNADFVLGKMRNPNWIYKGSEKRQKLINMTAYPIKPFIILNYWNTGRSYIDETCLMDQARPLQDILNKRGKQMVELADYANPRVLANGSLFDEGDAKKFINKNPKTIGLLNNMSPEGNINNAVMVIPAPQTPPSLMEDKVDARMELDAMMGTPTQFRGQESATKSNTLGSDLLVKQGASALQDDLVATVNRGWRKYYEYLIQMMNTFLPDDYFVITQGKDGEYAHIMLNQDTIDTNVRVSVTVDSTLPLDKQSQRATAIQLAQMQKIDLLSLYEMLGIPDGDKIVERTIRQQIDMYTYMQSVEQKLLSDQAEADLQLIIAGKEPEERDDYNEDYLNHFNLFITTNRFAQLAPDIKTRIVNYLHLVANKAATTEALRDSMVNPAGIIDRPPIFPLPKRTIQYRMTGMMDPQDTHNIAGPESALAIPVTQAQQAQGQPQPAPGQGSPPAQRGTPSPPRVINPSQFNAK